MSKYAKRKDGNHDAIKKAFIDAGWYWHDMFRYPGELDGEVVRRGKRGLVCTIRVEVKMLGEVVTPSEQKFMDTYEGLTLVAYTETDALYQANKYLERY